MTKEKLVLVGGDVVTPHNTIKHGVIVIQGETIKSVSTNVPDDAVGFKQIDCEGKVLLPGFIDVHTHGAIGLDFTDDDPDTAAKLSAYYYRHGVTTVLATLSSLPEAPMRLALERIATFCRHNMQDTNIFGIHMEGPYLNKTMRGGMAESFIQSPSFDSWRQMVEAGNGYIRLMTIAPELPGADEIIRDALHENIVVSMGHSTSSGEVTARAIELGATQVTHLFNAMEGLHHRKRGILIETLLSDEVDAQVIADGIHLNPQIIQLVLRLKSPDHLILITDSMCATQLPDGEYLSAGNSVFVTGGISRLNDGSLAGSTLTFENAVKNVVESTGIDLPAISRMSSLNAARSLGIHNHAGSIEPGKAADIVVLDQHFKVSMTIHRGIVKYRTRSS